MKKMGLTLEHSEYCKNQILVGFYVIYKVLRPIQLIFRKNDPTAYANYDIFKPMLIYILFKFRHFQVIFLYALFKKSYKR